MIRFLLESSSLFIFNKIMHLLAQEVEVIRFIATNEGIKLHISDSARVTFINLFFTNKFFNLYEISNNLYFEMKIKDLIQIIENIKDKKLEMSLENESNKIHIRVLGESLKLFEIDIKIIKECDGEISEAHVKDLENHLELPSKMLKSLIYITYYSDLITIFLTKEEFIFKFGDYYLKFDLRKSYNSIIKSSLKSNFYTKQLAFALAFSELTDLIKIRLGEASLYLEIALEKSSWIKLLIASTNDRGDLINKFEDFSSLSAYTDEDLRDINNEFEYGLKCLLNITDLPQDEDYIVKDINDLYPSLWRTEYRYPPWKTLTLAGWDNKGEPSCIILFGIHEFTGKQIIIKEKDVIQLKNESKFENFQLKMDTIGIDSSKEMKFSYNQEIRTGTYNLLKEELRCLGYILFRGKKGHFPSIKISDLIKLLRFINRYLNNDSNGIYSSIDNAEFCIFEPYQQIILPFFGPSSHNKVVKFLRTFKILFKDFKIAYSQNDLIKLDKEDIQFVDLTSFILMAQNSKIKREYIKYLIERSPPKGVYNRILELSNSETIAALLLELARIKNPILIEEVSNMGDSLFDWIEKPNEKRIKQSIRVYLETILPHQKQQEIKNDKNKIGIKNYPKIELPLSKGNISKEKQLSIDNREEKKSKHIKKGKKIKPGQKSIIDYLK